MQSEKTTETGCRLACKTVSVFFVIFDSFRCHDMHFLTLVSKSAKVEEAV